MTQMNGKTVLITGASRGIGKAAALEFAGAGANVVLLARSAKAVESLAQEIGGKALAIACDVADWAQVKAAVDLTVTTFGSIDVMVNNAGVIEPISSLADSDPDEWGKVIDINLKGVYYCLHAALPHMLKAGGGSVLTLSSGAAHGPMQGWAHYCSSKAGVHMLNQCLHTEEAENGIRAITLSPGTVATQMQRDIKASGINRVSELDWEDHCPPEWIAKALVWMCDTDADEFLGKEVHFKNDNIAQHIGVLS
ncbi:MAG TPA: SDR family oxidoreductase [Armatimonadetes bacterium]|nr:SDR family oxidoreductase [Armatimonadota bacterium]